MTTKSTNRKQFLPFSYISILSTSNAKNIETNTHQNRDHSLIHVKCLNDKDATAYTTSAKNSFLFSVIFGLILSGPIMADTNTINGIDVVNSFHRDVGVSFQEKSAISRLSNSSSASDFLSEDARRLSEALSQVYIGQSNAAGDVSVGDIINNAYSTLETMEDIRDASTGVQTFVRELSPIVDPSSNFQGLRVTLGLDGKVDTLNESLSGSEALWSDFGRDLQFVSVDGLTRSVSAGSKIGLALTPAGSVLSRASSLTDGASISNELRSGISAAKNLEAVVEATNTSLEILTILGSGDIDQLVLAEKIAKLGKALGSSIPEGAGQGLSVINDIRGIISSASSLGALDSVAALASKDDVSRIIVNIAAEDITTNLVGHIRKLVFDVADLTGTSNRVSSFTDGLTEAASNFSRVGTDRKISELYKLNDRLVDAQDELEVVRGSYQLYINQQLIALGKNSEEISDVYSPTIDNDQNLCDTYDCSNIWDTSNIGNGGEDSSDDDNKTTNTVVNTVDNTRDNELVTTETDAGERLIGNNAGTNIEIQPTGPTPEEIAEAERLAEEQRLAEIAEAERLAELRRQEIARLEIERTAQFEVKLAREVQIQNLDNELALLEFGDQQEVQNALSLVTGEEQRLRAELNDTGLSAADQQLLQDLLVYQETLEDELDRINDRISSLEGERDTLQSELDSANTVIIANSNQLNALDYDYNQFTEPTTSEELIDFSDYDYELPAFDPTELLTSDLSNVVGHAVSVPVVGGNNRVDIDLVAEDNTILDFGIPGAITEIENESSDLRDGFTHLYFGSGVDEYGDDSQWIYGEAATPEQFALRTGTATFNGGLSGYYAHGSVSDHTLYQDGVSGSLALEVDFGTNRLTGEGEIEIDTAVRNETLAFSLDESTISEKDGGLTRSVGFSSNATLEGESGVSGNLNGTLYGEDASEAAGSFAFDLGTGFSAGLWAAGENYDPEDGDEENGHSGAFVLGYSASSNEHGTAWREVNDIYGGEITLSDGRSGGDDGSVDIASTFNSSGFSHVSWGTWQANSTTPLPLDTYGPGYWIDVDNVTSPSAIENRTGSAEYNGEILGAFVGSGNIEEQANGLINITIGYGVPNEVAGSYYQFGRSCSDNGLNSCDIISEVFFSLEYLNDFDGSGFGNHGLDSSSGVIGILGGSNAEEIGGLVWASDDAGQYTGVFRAGEGLSFGGFLTPTTIDTNGSTDYSNYRGVGSFSVTNRDTGSTDLFFASVADYNIDVQFAPDESGVQFETTDGSSAAIGGITTNAAETANLENYSYVEWGRFDSSGNHFDDGSNEFSSTEWVVYDPTTDLRTTGQATYNGTASGLTSNGGAVSGSLQLTADFANDTVMGNMSLNTSNGQSWADASFDTSIRRDTDSSGFQGTLTGSDVSSGVIFGGFAGPNAEEVGGGWQIDNANGTDGVGIFRAQN